MLKKLTPLFAFASFVLVVSLHTEGYACHQKKNPKPHGHETSCNGGDQCQADLATCNTNLSSCTTDLGTCSSALNQANSDLANCETDLAACEAQQAIIAPVPQTLQTTCYDMNGDVRACAGTGEDGDLLAGVAPPVPHFTDNFDGTFTDNRTGLTWLENANCPNTFRTWQQALNDVAQLNTDGTMNGNNCGYTGAQTDWRLPNLLELLSLLNFENANGGQPNGDPFMGTLLSSNYWSSTTFTNTPRDAWMVSFNNGGVGSNTKDNFISVVAVRGP